jgi:hypothetical protein
VGGEKNLRDKFINQFKMQIKEQSNPELDRTVGQFVSALAKKYSYSNADAVMAVFEALKRLGMLDKSSNYKAPSGAGVAESRKGDQPVNEGVLTIAAGVILGFMGLKLLGAVARKIVGAIGANVKQEPAKLKLILKKVVEDTIAEAGSMLGANLIQIAIIKGQIDKKIDSGEITTIGEMMKAFEALTKE